MAGEVTEGDVARMKEESAMLDTVATMTKRSRRMHMKTAERAAEDAGESGPSHGDLQRTRSDSIVFGGVGGGVGGIELLRLAENATLRLRAAQLLRHSLLSQVPVPQRLV
jgi:hypothetical protein